MKTFIIGVWNKKTEKKEFYKVTEQELEKLKNDKDIKIFATQEI